MQRKDATRIQELALEACDAINRMERIVLGLSKEERLRFANHFGDAYAALQFGILKEIYDRYPDLRIGHEEPPVVSSFLKWADVALPANVSEADLDAAIFSVLKPTWQKTAMVIAKAGKECDSRRMDVDFEVLGARILALAEGRRLESQGELTMWRHSEVRLKRENPDRT